MSHHHLAVPPPSRELVCYEEEGCPPKGFVFGTLCVQVVVIWYMAWGLWQARARGHRITDHVCTFCLAVLVDVAVRA